MGSKYTKRYTEEFKRDAIALVDSSGKTVTAVARELGISSESLRGWYRRAKADRGEGQPGELTSAEREELRRLRKENREQQQTIEILKKATAFFVKESDRFIETFCNRRRLRKHKIFGYLTPAETGQRHQHTLAA
ncbi:transposase [Streptomyces yerevanensis]|uniref:transposase n=1 Tax=Streptomyces yerevanensis TaxID=66378 RepID=UPI0009971A83|nr:transposase [Streptomyces yerevanensis]